MSNTEAVDFDNLIDGATRLSAVADQAGMSFEQMLGTLTGGYEILVFAKLLPNLNDLSVTLSSPSAVKSDTFSNSIKEVSIFDTLSTIL